MDKTDKAKCYRSKYGRGAITWADAKKELIKLGYDSPTASKILLGTEHLLGD